MNDDRKGALTKEQEKFLEEIIKFANPVLEAVDGPLISLIDNQGIERVLDLADKANPEIRVMVYQVVDSIFDPLIGLIKGKF